MEILTIIENTIKSADFGLEIESGLSLFFEYQGKKILFDTGESDKMIVNARKLQVPLETLDLIVISHGHFDHTGALEHIMDMNKTVRVIMRLGTDGTFVGKLGPIKKNVGVPQSLFTKYRNRIEFITENLEPIPGLTIFTSIKQTRPLVKGNSRILKKVGDSFVPDDFTHEVVVSLKLSNGLVILTGCSHNGVQNMIDAVKVKYPKDSIISVLGGFHLMGIPFLKNSMSISPTEVEQIAKELLAYNIQKIYTMHCTGMKAFGIMKAVMKDRLKYLATGEKVQL